MVYRCILTACLLMTSALLLDATASNPIRTSCTYGGANLVASLVIGEPGSEVRFDFDRSVEVGRFADGIWWVVGPLTITAVSPPYNSVEKRHGQMFGFTPNMPGESNADNALDARVENFGEELLWQPPQYLSSAFPTRIIKALSYSLDPMYDGTPLRRVYYFVVLPAIPVNRGVNSLAPSYLNGVSGHAYFDVDRLWGNLQSASPRLSGSATFSDELVSETGESTAAEAVSNMFGGGLWIDGQLSWTGARIRPAEGMPGYAPLLARVTSVAGMLLVTDEFLHNTTTGKCALARFVRVGIDYYRQIELFKHLWVGNGGHYSGRKLPTVLAAYLASDVLDVSQLRAWIDEKNTFQEDSSLYENAICGETPIYGDRGSFFVDSEADYWQYLVNPPFANYHQTDWYQYTDPIEVGVTSHVAFRPAPHDSGPWVGAGVVVQTLSNATFFWNNWNFLAYLKRFVKHGEHFEPDPCAPIHGSCSMTGAACTSATSTCECELSLDGLGVLFGPDPENPGQCIQGDGRFPQMHHINGGVQYSSALATSFFSLYVEDRPTPAGDEDPCTMEYVSSAQSTSAGAQSTSNAAYTTSTAKPTLSSPSSSSASSTTSSLSATITTLISSTIYESGVDGTSQYVNESSDVASSSSMLPVIVGGAIACLVVIAVVVGGLVLFKTRKRKHMPTHRRSSAMHTGGANRRRSSAFHGRSARNSVRNSVSFASALRPYGNRPSIGGVGGGANEYSVISLVPPMSSAATVPNSSTQRDSSLSAASSAAYGRMPMPAYGEMPVSFRSGDSVPAPTEYVELALNTPSSPTTNEYSVFKSEHFRKDTVDRDSEYALGGLVWKEAGPQQ